MNERNDPRTTVPRLWVWLAAILLLGLAVRVATIDYALWYDEVASTKFAAAPLRQLWSDWMVRETNPPLYYALLGGWMQAFGDGDRAARGMSIAIGMVGLVLAFLVGRRVGGDRAGLIATALIALSSQHVLYSQQVRGYILGHSAALAAILAVLAFLAHSDIDGNSRRRTIALAGYAATCTIALYSHTMLVLLPALVNVFVIARLLLARDRRWRALFEWIAANAVVLLAWSWWARITLLQATSSSNIQWIGTPSLLYAVRMTLESYVPWDIGPAQFLVALLALAAVAHMAWHRRTRPDALLLPFLALAAPPLLYLLSLKVPVFLNRTIYWPSGPFLIAVAVGIADLRVAQARWAAIAVGLLASVTGLIAWLPKREIEPWPAVVARLQQDPQDRIVVTRSRGAAFALHRYCRAPDCNLRIFFVPSPAHELWASDFPVKGSINEAGLSRFLLGRRRVTTVIWNGNAPFQHLLPGVHIHIVSFPNDASRSVMIVRWSIP